MKIFIFFKRTRKVKSKHEEEGEVLSEVVNSNKLNDKPAYSVDEMIQLIKAQKTL